MFFNKLYNLILENIITQNKASRAQLLANVQNHQQIQNFLNQLALKGKVQNKAADFLAKYFKSGQLIDIKDQRIQQVISILKRLTNFNIQTQITLNQFLKQNEIYFKRSKAQNENYLDSIKEFSQKKEYSNGVVTYRVEQSRAGQAAVRKIIDMQWSQKANPWCLASRGRGGLSSNYKSYWLNYIAFPKHIAFQNGKLLAFCASNHGNCTWWNRNDHGTDKLELLDGSYMQTQKYYWTGQQLANMFVIKNELILNEKTGRYDSDRSLHIYNSRDLFNGHLPVPLGVIKGNFDCQIEDLKYDEELPTEVEGRYNIEGCYQLPFYNIWLKNKFLYLNALKYNEQTGKYDGNRNLVIRQKDLVNGHFPYQFGIINGNFSVLNCKLKDLKGAPTEVKGKISYKGTTVGNKNLDDNLKDMFLHNHKSVKYNQQTGKYDCNGDLRIKASDLTKEGKLPIKLGKVKGNIQIINVAKLVSLEGMPDEVDGNFSCSDCSKLTSLQGGPKWVGGTFVCRWCKSLTSLKGAPKEINGRFDCSGCQSLTSLVGGPKQVGRDFYCIFCLNLKSLTGAPQRVGGNFSCNSCNNLTSLIGGPKQVGGQYACNVCKLSNLKGIADHVGTWVECYDQRSEGGLTITPQERKKYSIKGKVKDVRRV